MSASKKAKVPAAKPMTDAEANEIIRNREPVHTFGVGLVPALIVADDHCVEVVAALLNAITNNDGVDLTDMMLERAAETLSTLVCVQGVEIQDEVALVARRIDAIRAVRDVLVRSGRVAS